MPSLFALQAQKEAAISAAKDEIITFALGLLITHKNASISLNVTRKLTWPSSKNGTIFAPTAIQRNNFNRDADASIVRLGIEAGLWADSSEAGKIGIETIEEYIMREEKKLVQERLRTTSSMLNGIVQRLEKCATNDFDQGLGSARPGEPWGAAKDELRNALRAIQDYRKVEKSVRVDRDTGFLEGDVAGVQPIVADCTWDGEGRAWGMGDHSDCDEEYNGTWEDQDEKKPGTQNQGGWVTTDQADSVCGKRIDQDWDGYEQEGVIPVNQSLQDPVSTANPGCDAGSEVNRDGTRSRPGFW